MENFPDIAPALAAVITALGVLMAGIGALVSALGTSRRVKETQGHVVETRGMVEQIDAAVNGKQPGETTMVSQVQDLHNQIPNPRPDAVLPLLRKLVVDVENLKEQVKP